MPYVYISVYFILAYFSPLFSTLYFTDKDILTYLSRVRLVTPQSTTKSPKPVFLVDSYSAGPLSSSLPKSSEKIPESQNYGLTDLQPVPVTDPSEICISESLNTSNSSELEYLQGKFKNSFF